MYLSNNSSLAGPEDPTVQTQGQTGAVTEGSTEGTTGLQKTRSCDNLLLMSDLNTSLSRRKSDPNIAMDHGEQQTQKLLKDAIGGDTSCSSESVKSSENERSLSENGDAIMNGSDGPHRLEDKEVSESGIAAAGYGDAGIANGVDNCDNNVTTDDNKCSNINTQVESNGQEQETADSEVENSENGEQLEANGADVNLEEKSVTTLEKSLPNGLSNGELGINGNGTHEMNGHVENHPEKRGQSPDSSNDSSENSIETISEGEENENIVNGANSHENGELESKKLSYTRISNGFNNGDNKDIDSKIVSMKLKQRNVNGARYAPSLESSSDTVIDDLQNGDSSHTLKTSSSKNVNEVASLQSLCNRVTTNALNSIENTISISTSTSDLTDSRIHERVLANGLPGDNLLNVRESLHTSLKLRCILSQTGLCKGSNGVYKGMNVDTSIGSSLQPTPVSPQSRNSTCPPTPGTSDARVRILKRLACHKLTLLNL